jgi:hypothetical protein
MRYRGWIVALLWLAACGSGSDQAAKLILVNPTWDRVHVEIVVTKSTDCDKQDAYVSTKEIVMSKDQSHTVTTPNAEGVCWRHDRDPNNPVEGVWSGWSRATLFPGQTAETDL